MPTVRVQRATVLPALGQGSAPTADDWTNAIVSFNPAQAQLLKEDSGTAVYRTTLLGRDVVIKRWSLNSPAAHLKSLLKASRAHRHWRGAQWLLKHDVPTAQPYALATESSPLGRFEWLVMEALHGKTLLEHIADGDLSVREEHLVARLLGRQIAELVGLISYNRDYKPSNLLLIGPPDARQVAVIDTVAIRRGWNPEQMLVSLWIEPAGCRLTIRRTLSMRVLSSFLKRWAEDRSSEDDTPEQLKGYRNRHWNAVREQIARHGDPTPRVNPLSSGPVAQAPPIP